MQDSFLARFNAIDDDSWQELVRGRVGRLQLHGSQGASDIYVLYLPTGSESAPERARVMRTISENVSARSEVLSVLLGDFNFVEDSMDRWNKERSAWTGHHDDKDAKEFDMTLWRPHGLNELHQPVLTCENAIARSRKDRVCSNHFLFDQLDRSYVCTALPWTALSAHPALSFARKAPTRGKENARPLPVGPMKHPSWGRRIALDYHQRIAEDPLTDNAIRKLVLLKRSIKQVTLCMQREGLNASAAENDDRLAGPYRSPEQRKRST